MSKRQKDFMYFLIKYKGYTSIEAGILASILVKYWLLSKYELGKTKITFEYMKKFCSTFNIEVQRVLDLYLICSIGMTFFAMLILLSGDIHGYAFLCLSSIGVFLIHEEGKRYKEEITCLIL